MVSLVGGQTNWPRPKEQPAAGTAGGRGAASAACLGEIMMSNDDCVKGKPSCEQSKASRPTQVDSIP